MLSLYKRVMLGQVTNKEVMSFNDLYLYETAALAPLVVIIIYLGIMPNSVIKTINLSVKNLVKIYSLL